MDKPTKKFNSNTMFGRVVEKRELRKGEIEERE